MYVGKPISFLEAVDHVLGPDVSDIRRGPTYRVQALAPITVLLLVCRYFGATRPKHVPRGSAGQEVVAKAISRRFFRWVVCGFQDDDDRDGDNISTYQKLRIICVGTCICDET